MRGSDGSDAEDVTSLVYDGSDKPSARAQLKGIGPVGCRVLASRQATEFTATSLVCGRVYKAGPTKDEGRNGYGVLYEGSTLH